MIVPPFLNSKDKMIQEENVSQELVMQDLDNSGKSTSSEETIRLLQEQVAQLMQNQTSPIKPGADGSNMELLVSMLANALNKKEEQPKTGQFSFDTMHTTGDYDPKDILPPQECVTFITHRTFYVIADDKRNGLNIRAPKNMIVFKYESTKQVKSGRETDLIHLSTYTCSSRTELEWLRNHSHFGITFFDKISTALTIDAVRGANLAKKMLSLQKIGHHNLIKMAQSYDLPVLEDLNMMRIQIAQASVEAEMDKQKDFMTSMLVEQHLEAEAVGKKNAQS